MTITCLSVIFVKWLKQETRFLTCSNAQTCLYVEKCNLKILLENRECIEINKYFSNSKSRILRNLVRFVQILRVCFLLLWLIHYFICIQMLLYVFYVSYQWFYLPTCLPTYLPTYLPVRDKVIYLQLNNKGPLKRNLNTRALQSKILILLLTSWIIHTQRQFKVVC